MLSLKSLLSLILSYLFISVSASPVAPTNSTATPISPSEAFDGLLQAFIPAMQALFGDGNNTGRMSSDANNPRHTGNSRIVEIVDDGEEQDLPPPPPPPPPPPSSAETRRDQARDRSGRFIASFFNLIGGTAKEAIEKSQNGTDSAEIAMAALSKTFFGLKRIVDEQ